VSEVYKCTQQLLYSISESQNRLQALQDTTEAMKRHSKQDVLRCWRNGLWAVARCIKKLKAAHLPSLTSTLYAA
jgi:hypothetical protein